MTSSGLSAGAATALDSAGQLDALDILDHQRYVFLVEHLVDLILLDFANNRHDIDVLIFGRQFEILLVSRCRAAPTAWRRGDR